MMSRIMPLARESTRRKVQDLRQHPTEDEEDQGDSSRALQHLEYNAAFGRFWQRGRQSDERQQHDLGAEPDQ